MRHQRVRSLSRDAVIAISAALLTSAVSYYMFSKQFNTDEKYKLNQNLNKLLDIDMQYPFLEDSAFVARWDLNKAANSDSALRYQYYCIYVFNFLQGICDYYRYDKRKIARYVDIDDLIGLHKSWWNLPENQTSESYDPEFRNFVNELYK
jgi:hypothetical protein